jgi:hypothetical protein
MGINKTLHKCLQMVQQPALYGSLCGKQSMAATAYGD